MLSSRMAIEVFCSYSHEDEPYRRQFEKHLSTLKQQGLISFWHDQQILPGTSWAKAIDTHLSTASIILLLVSSDFIASDYCTSHEMKRALERHTEGSARVIPVVVRPCDWQQLPIGKLQALPPNAHPVSLWANADEAWTQVTAGLRRIIEDLSFLTASAPRTVLPPIWMLPYPRNPFFLGRDELLSQIHTQLQAGEITALSQPQAICGLGGIGKTQLAVEYAYRYFHEYRMVLWARAESRDTLNASYAQIITKLNLPEKGTEGSEIIIQSVKTWLCDHRHWLLILDNADELALLQDFLPPVGGGHLIITTRAQAMGRLAHHIEVQTFSAEEGALFLLRRAALLAPDATLSQAFPEDRQLARQITQELGGLPLALDQAGAYLEETGYGLSDYQRMYHQYRGEFFKERRGLVADYPEAVATTWSLSFRRVEERDPAAADLLRLCAYLAPDAIPEDLLRRGASYLGPVLEPVVTHPLLLGQAIKVLRAYSLLVHDPHMSTLSVHRLVQAVLRESMEASENTAWKQRAVLAVEAACPDGAEWHVYEQWLSHVLVCVAWIEQEQMKSLEAARLLHKAGYYLYNRARYIEAEQLQGRASAIGEQGSETSSLDIKLHEEVPISEIDLCRVDERQHTLWYGIDIPRSIPTYMDLDAPDHAPFIKEVRMEESYPPDIAAYLNRGYGEMEPLYERALDIKYSYLGPEHLDTAASLNNLAILYQSQGQYEKAEPLLKRALSIYEQQLGTEHFWTRIIRRNYVWVQQGVKAGSPQLQVPGKPMWNKQKAKRTKKQGKRQRKYNRRRRR